MAYGYPLFDDSKPVQHDNMKANYSKKAMRRKAALVEIEKAVCVNRSKTHGDAEDNFDNIAKVWTIQLSKKLKDNVSLDSLDVAAMMSALKLCRIIQDKTHMDHWIDCAGYAVCGAGILQSLSPSHVTGRKKPQHVQYFRGARGRFARRPSRFNSKATK